jgi:hypothetical protein
MQTIEHGASTNWRMGVEERARNDSGRGQPLG